MEETKQPIGEDIYGPMTEEPKSFKTPTTGNYYLGGRQKERRETKREYNKRVGPGDDGKLAYRGSHGKGRRPHQPGHRATTRGITQWSRDNGWGLGHAQAAARQRWLDSLPKTKSKKK